MVRLGSSAVGSGPQRPLPPVPDVAGQPRPPVPDGYSPSSPGLLRPLCEHLDPEAPPSRLAWGPATEPPLEAVRRRRADAWVTALAAGVAGAVGGAALTALVVWLTNLPVTPSYLLIGAGVLSGFGFLGTLLGYSGITVVAGARWVASDRSGPVRLYELTRARIDTPENQDRELQLDDRYGGRFRCPLELVGAHPELWALVCNGIRHSAAAGAETDDDVRQILAADSPGTSGDPSGNA